MLWKSEMDHLKRFVAEQCIVAPGPKVSVSLVYDRYMKWCSDCGEHALPGFQREA